MLMWAARRCLPGHPDRTRVRGWTTWKWMTMADDVLLGLSAINEHRDYDAGADRKPVDVVVWCDHCSWLGTAGRRASYIRGVRYCWAGGPLRCEDNDGSEDFDLCREHYLQLPAHPLFAQPSLLPRQGFVPRMPPAVLRRVRTQNGGRGAATRFLDLLLLEARRWVASRKARRTACLAAWTAEDESVVLEVRRERERREVRRREEERKRKEEERGRGRREHGQVRWRASDGPRPGWPLQRRFGGGWLQLFSVRGCGGGMCTARHCWPGPADQQCRRARARCTRIVCGGSWRSFRPAAGGGSWLGCCRRELTQQGRRRRRWRRHQR